MNENMHDIQNIRLHRFPGGPVAEVIGETAQGEVIVRTISFRVREEDDGLLEPIDPLPAEIAGPVKTHVQADGYAIADPDGPVGSVG